MSVQQATAIISQEMKITVECYAGYRGEETPRRLLFDQRAVEVDQVIDQWHGDNYRYFKVLGSDRATYILRHDLDEHSWETTMYQVASGQN